MNEFWGGLPDFGEEMEGRIKGVVSAENAEKLETLRDQVAIAVLPTLMSDNEMEFAIEEAFEYADAFIAEKKRRAESKSNKPIGSNPGHTTTKF